MPINHHECQACDAVFRIKYDMDDHYYEVKYCPFCGAEITQEEDYGTEEE
jgi:uncharacterized paraquat-inducible protein A